MQRHFPELLRSRRAVSAVVSNMVLIGAVIAVGFSVLVWSGSRASMYNNQYSKVVKSDTDQLRERLVFEFISYDKAANDLKVYLMNSGTIGDVSITNAYVNDTSYTVSTLRFLDGTPTSSLDVAQEGYFSIIDISSLDLGKDYAIKIVTRRGSSFAATFAT